MNRRLSLFALSTSVLAALACIPSSAKAYVLQYAGSGDKIRWEESCFRYSVHESGVQDIDTADLHDVVRASFDTWENVDCSYFYFEETDDAACDKIGYEERIGNLNLLIFREDDWAIDKDHDASAIALTTTSWDDLSGRMLDADIEFNAENFTFGTDGSLDKADIENTATHEIGHMLGLDHSNVDGSTMAPTAGTGDIDKRTLADDDIEGLCELYPLAEDPDVCLDPHCGLDLSCDSTDCKKTGIAYTDQQPSNACTIAANLGYAEPHDHLRMLFALLPWTK